MTFELVETIGIYDYTSPLKATLEQLGFQFVPHQSFGVACWRCLHTAPVYVELGTLEELYALMERLERALLIDYRRQTLHMYEHVDPEAVWRGRQEEMTWLGQEGH